MKHIFIALALFNVLLMPFIYLFLGQVWFLNAQIAFMTSSLVMLASMLSYSNIVKRGLSTSLADSNQRDSLDKVEDPYELYDEDKPVENENLDLKEVVVEERARLKKSRRSVWETTKDVKSSFSFYRLAAYTCLVLGFFYLNLNDLLELLPYLLFLSLPPLISVFILMTRKH